MKNSGKTAIETRNVPVDFQDPIERVRNLPIWSGKVDPVPLEGGITNINLVVQDNAQRYLVRVGTDIPVHQIMRFNEIAASRAAYEAGLSPAVIYHEPGIMVLDFIEGHTLSAEDVRGEHHLDRIIKLVRSCHNDVPKYLRGPIVMFWVFHVLRDYAATLKENSSPYRAATSEFLSATTALEAASGPVTIVFGHNDLLPANFIDDGQRLWLIDWDYAGFNSPLFDLGGLASNNDLTEVQERYMLESYFGQTADDELFHRYHAMKCASLLRETLWSMVSEIHSDIDFDYARYTAQNMARFERAYDIFQHA